MKHILSIILLSIATFSTAQDQPIPGEIPYVNDCAHYGALAVAVADVRDRDIFPLPRLIQDEISFFRRSRVSEGDIQILISMITEVYTSQNSGPELFEDYAMQCTHVLNKALPVASPPDSNQVPILIQQPDEIQ